MSIVNVIVIHSVIQEMKHVDRTKPLHKYVHFRQRTIKKLITVNHNMEVEK
jgi:hypothetical protein